jgi:hypothetical protein
MPKNLARMADEMESFPRRSYSSEFLAQVSRVMDGEPAVAACDFSAGPRYSDLMIRTWVVGTANLWMIGLKQLRGIRRSERWEPKDGQCAPLSSVAAVTRTSGQRTFMGNPRLTLTVQSAFGRDVLTTAWAEGIEFADALELATRRSKSSSSLADEIEQLAELRRLGMMDDAELERAKGLLLGRAPDAQQKMLELLVQLHSLHRQGVLSESEFNMKKWDILSRRPRSS